MHLGLSNFAGLRIRSALRLPGAGLPPAVLYRRISRLSQGTANPCRATRMVRPLSRQNPVGVARPVPPGRWPFSLALPNVRRVGRSLESPSVLTDPKTGSVLPASLALRPAGFNQRGYKTTPVTEMCQSRICPHCPQILSPDMTWLTQPFEKSIQPLFSGQIVDATKRIPVAFLEGRFTFLRQNPPQWRSWKRHNRRL